jgi:hypothetical protein
MPFDSNGVFTRVMNWTSDQQNGIAIECGRHDQEDDNFAEGFNDTFCRDGRAAATGDFNLGQYKITNLANGIASTDAVTKGQLDSVNSTLTANSVNLTGTQTITGAKTFTGGVYLSPTTLLKQSAVEGGAVYFEPPTSTSLTGPALIDITGNLMRFVGQNSLGNYTTPLSLDLETGVAVATPSDAPNSVVTTTAISKGASGYVKLGNGMIIQWGIVGTGANFSVTFPTPFSSSASYGVAVAPLYDNGADAYALNVKYRTNTGFTGYLNANYNGASYIAIGY